MPGVRKSELDELTVQILYKNYRGETAWRTVRPVRIHFGSNEWHPVPQWLMDAMDIERAVERSFAMKDIERWSPARPGR
jgi:hypothetical protein